MWRWRVIQEIEERVKENVNHQSSVLTVRVLGLNPWKTEFHMPTKKVNLWK